MAKKSKTQRAKASANRAAKKERAAKQAQATPVVEEQPTKKRFGFKKAPAKTVQASSKPAPKPRRLRKSLRRSALLSFLKFVLKCVVLPGLLSKKFCSGPVW